MHSVKLTREGRDRKRQGGNKGVQLWLGRVGRALLRSLSNDDGHGNEDGKKAIVAIGLAWQSNNLICTCITLFSTFLCRRCTTATQKCLISRFVKDVSTRQQLSFSSLDTIARGKTDKGGERRETVGDMGGGGVK